MLLMMTGRKAVLRLLITAIFSAMWGGCATTGSPFREAGREVVVEMSPESPIADIELMVSNSDQARDAQYPTTLMIESDAAPGFMGGPGSAGVCSGVLIAKKFVLTAAHCMCLQPIHNSSNKAINRSDCATRAQVSRYMRKVERLKSGGKRITNDFTPTWGSAFLPDEFRVDLNAQGQLVSVRADVAVIRLESAIEIKLDFQPADREFRINDRITLVGFGSISANGKQASESPHFGKNTVTGIRLMEYEPRVSPGKQDTVGQFHREYEANTESGDSGGPCFREEGKRRWLMGIMLHKVNSTGVKTTCLDLFHSKALIDRLIQQASGNTN